MKHTDSIRTVLTAIAVLCSLYLSAQVTIVPAQPGIYGYGYTELSQTNIINTSAGPIQGVYAVIECTSGSGKVFSIRTTSIDLAPGSNFMNYGQLVSAEQLYATSAYYQMQQTGRLPAGTYNCCINLYRIGSSAGLAQQCVNFTVSVSSTLMLLSPFDKQVLNTFFPSLFWSFSYINPDDIVTYSIKISELKQGQTYIDAISYNLPLVFEENLMQTSYLYPSSALPLEESKKYVWQVEASLLTGKKYLSEIWMFQYKKDRKEDKVIKEKVSEPYASLTKNLSSVNYAFEEKINFTYNNETKDTVLNYKVFAEGSVQPFMLNADKVKIQHGLNRLSFEIPRTMSAKEASGKSYTLEVYNSRNEVLKMKFYIKQKRK